MPAARRRWFRYSLRTLFVAVTLICFLLAYQANWIRQRHAFLAKADAAKLAVVMGVKPTTQPSAFAPTDVPWSLQLFGEPAVAGIFGTVEKKMDAKTAAAAKRLFPEANIGLYPFGGIGF